MADTHPKKLGRLKSVHGPDRLRKVRHYDAAALPVNPASVRYGSAVADWLMLGNDTVGDCAPVGILHFFMSVNADAGHPIAFTDADALNFYARVTDPPFDPRTGANDNGANMDDVINVAIKSGVNGHRLDPARAPLDPSNVEQVKAGLHVGGGVYLGFNLPRAVKNAEEWDIPEGQPLVGAWAPGSWGGHAVVGVWYDAGSIYVVTWRKLLRCSWRFFVTYCDEADVLLCLEWFDAETGKAASGYDVPTTRYYFAALGGPPAPPPAPPEPPAPVIDFGDMIGE